MMESAHPPRPAWSPGHLALAAAALALLGVAAVLFVADDADATHYWAGTLQWNRTTTVGPVDTVMNEIQPTVLMSGKMGFRWSWWGQPPACTIVNPLGTIATTDPQATVQPWVYVILRTDSDRDMAVVRFVAAGTDGAAACTLADDDSRFDVPIMFTSKNQGDGVPHKVWWSDCCRIGYGDDRSNYHVNNPHDEEWLETFVDLSSPNKSPISELIPIRFCPVDALCTFPMNTTEPDQQRLQFRLATSKEAEPNGAFHQPGPTCPRCAPVENTLTIDEDTGVVTWHTMGAEIVDTCNPSEPGCPERGRRNLYSMQVMTTDGKTWVPNDFMIELIEPPEVHCVDGSIPPIDQWTGKYRLDWCPVDNPPACGDPGTDVDPACNPVPPSEQVPRDYRDPAEPKPFWIAPGTTASGAWAARSDGADAWSSPQDRVNQAIAELDSDGDGVIDRWDLCPNVREVPADTDADGIGNACDMDLDDDGLPNEADLCPTDATDSCDDASEETLAGRAGEQQAAGDMASSRSPVPARGGETVPVHQEGATKSPLGSVMLAVLGAALLVLLLGMAMRRRT